jgi:hypothetical protein
MSYLGNVPRTLTSAMKSRLEARAKRGHAAVDVEHLLPFATLGDPAAASFLRELAERHAWPTKKRGFVPLGMWAESIAVLLDGGARALVRGVKNQRLDADVVLGLLEEVDGPDAVEACLELSRSKGLESKARSALMMILGRGETVLPATLEAKLRKSAHAFLAKKRSDMDLATTYDLLATVGDLSSLTLMESAPATSATGPYAGARDEAMKQLARRLKITRRR